MSNCCWFRSRRTWKRGNIKMLSAVVVLMLLLLCNPLMTPPPPPRGDDDDGTHTHLCLWRHRSRPPSSHCHVIRPNFYDHALACDSDVVVISFLKFSQWCVAASSPSSSSEHLVAVERTLISEWPVVSNEWVSAVDVILFIFIFLFALIKNNISSSSNRE